MQFTTMICYVTETFDPPIAHPEMAGASDTWVRDFRQIITSLQKTSHSVTTLLSIIAAAIGTGKPLPPYLEAPSPVYLSQLLNGVDPGILSTQHVGEPGYAALAVMQVATAMLNDDLRGLLAEAKKLVGEAKFNISEVTRGTNGHSEDSGSDEHAIIESGIKQD